VTLIRFLGRLVARNKLLVAITVVGAAAIIGVSAAAGLRAGATAQRGAGATAQGAAVAADFTVAALGTSGPAGRQISLSKQYQNKPVIVNFWASWCGPCQQETPLLARWYKRQHGAVSLIGIDENDNAAKAIAFASSKGVTYPLGFDPQTRVASAYNVSDIPQTLFLDSRHRIVLHLYGAVTSAGLARGLRLMSGA
jgi:thiol-disulfide isomerase/thioredoxin